MFLGRKKWFPSVVLVLLAALIGNGKAAYNRKHEPWKTMIQEGKILMEKTDVFGLTTDQQEKLFEGWNEPMTVESLGAKIVLDNPDWLPFNKSISDEKSTDYKRIKEELGNGLKTIFGPNFGSDTNFTGNWLIHEVAGHETTVGTFPLVFFQLNSTSTKFSTTALRAIKRAIILGKVGNLHVRNGSAEVYRMVEKRTVYEIFLQLYNEPYLPGMDWPDSRPYQNMSDQMIHLVGTRFRNMFGEHFYRMVILGFTPSLNSVIVRANILLDPSEDNLYHASIIWYHLDGYIYLSKFPLLPSNVKVYENRIVLKDFYEYLHDRTYKRPHSNEESLHPLLYVTLPAVIGIVASVILLMVLLRCCHFCAIEYFNKDLDFKRFD